MDEVHTGRHPDMMGSVTVAAAADDNTQQNSSPQRLVMRLQVFQKFLERALEKVAKTDVIEKVHEEVVVFSGG